MPLISLNRISRHSIIIPMGVVIAASLWFGSAAQAGLIVNWQHQPGMLETDFGSNSGSSAAEADEPASSQESQSEHEQPGHTPSLRLLDAVENLVPTSGGASAPSAPSSFHGTSSVGLVLDAPAALMLSCSIRYLRESVVRLPQPPPGELLDPPKSCA